MRSEVNKIYDADNAFRAPGLGAITATAIVGAKPLDKLVKLRPSAQRNKLGAQEYEIVIVVSAIDKVTGDETYTFTAEVGAAGSAATKVGELKVVSTGQYVLCLDAASIEKLDAAHAEIELNVALAGTTPSITFSAWLS